MEQVRHEILPGFTAAEQAAWLDLLRVMIHMPAALDSHLRDQEMLGIEYYVMAHLAAAPDRRLQMSYIASEANVSLSRLSHVCRRLEQRGWVRREPLASNRRVVLAILTEEGHAKFQQATPDHLALVRRLVFGGMSAKQVDQLATISALLLQQLHEVTETPAPAANRSNAARRA